MKSDKWPPEDSEVPSSNISPEAQDELKKKTDEQRGKFEHIFGDLQAAGERLVGENQELHEHATIDALTGIRNRRGFEETLHTATAGFFTPEAERRGEIEKGIEHITVGLFDVDHFKDFNDKYGHQVGDRVLKAVAQHLASIGRGSDIVARWGGEEFVFAWPGASEKAVLQKFGMDLKKGQNARIEIPKIKIDDQEFEITISGGLSTFPHKP
ncbi:MAG: GGDEF domain-containing protein, partial [Patescibacteria group bacterium]